MKTNLKNLKQEIHNNIELIFSHLDMDGEFYKNNYYCCCPIHDGSDNPKGFSYDIDKKIWNCWTHSCHEEYNRDILGLIMAVLSKKRGKKVSFKETLSWVYKTLKTKPKYINNDYEFEPSDFQKLINKINKDPLKSRKTPKLNKNLKLNIPSSYFISRGFQSKTLEEFSVGDCTDKSSDMKNRSVIPVHGESGDTVVGLIGRATLDYIEPKFKANFDKSNYLYNYHRAKKTAQKLSTIILVEGQGDVWRLWECGVKNCVGLFGKEFYLNQRQLIEKLGITKIIVIMDHDQPGREAKIKIKRECQRYFKLQFISTPTNKDIGQMSPDLVNNKILSQIKGQY